MTDDSAQTNNASSAAAPINATSVIVTSFFVSSREETDTGYQQNIVHRGFPVFARQRLVGSLSNIFE